MDVFCASREAIPAVNGNGRQEPGKADSGQDQRGDRRRKMVREAARGGSDLQGNDGEVHGGAF